MSPIRKKSVPSPVSVVSDNKGQNKGVYMEVRYIGKGNTSVYLNCMKETVFEYLSKIFGSASLRAFSSIFGYSVR